LIDAGIVPRLKVIIYHIVNLFLLACS